MWLGPWSMHLELAGTGRARDFLHGETAEFCDIYFARDLDILDCDAYIEEWVEKEN